MSLDIQVVGLLADAGNARGGYPVQLVSNIADAVEMRFGNTLVESTASEWLPYAANSTWVIPTGIQQKEIYAEFRLSDGSVVQDIITVPDFDPALGTDYPWPTVTITQSATVLWGQTFDTGHDYWVSYDYGAGVLGNGNVFYPTTWASSGGVDGGGYIWADDSRWRIDTPESPDLVSPFSIRGQFVNSAFTTSDFNGATARFSLRGENLNLEGGQANFWVMDQHGRVINLGEPLDIVDGVWTLNEVRIASVNDDDWEVSFLPDPGLIDPTQILAWGISFQDFSGEPSGRIDLDNFSIEFLPDPADPLGPVKSGAEITVKRDTGANETDPSVVAFSNGGSNVVWTDADANAVYAQLMTADGSKFVDRIEIATNAIDATVGSLPDGFVVAWDDLGGGGATPSIMGRLYDRDGASLVDIQISSPGPDSDTDPRLAVSASADFIVTWIREGTGRDVYARVFGDDGQSVGPEFSITTTGTVLGVPVVTALASGAFFVAWEDSDNSDPADTSGTNIRGRLVHSDGTADIPFVVNSTASGNQSDLAIVSLATGGFLIVWLDGSEDPSSVIRARAFDANGIPAALDFIVARSDTDVLQDIAAVALPDGQFAISWTDLNAGTSTSDIHARIMSEDGSAIGDSFIVNYATAGLGNEGHSSITVLADGRIMVTWTDADGAGSAIRAQIFDQRSGGVTLVANGDNSDWVGTPFGDSFFPGGGASHIIGGLGDDWYYLSGSTDTIVERTGQGDHDRILVSFDYAMPAFVQVEELTTTDDAGTAALHLTGNEFANTITGNAGDNWLNYGGVSGPADTLIGLGGDDWYFVYRSNDVVVEAIGGGNDRVLAAVDYTLAAGQEIEALSTDNNGGTAPLRLTGNEFANTIIGNAGNNELDGGSSGAADTLIGLGGDDTYLVHRSADTAIEAAGEGTDTVRADVSYTLTAGQEIEALSASNSAGTAALHLTGNEFANTITGNAGNNVLDGGSTGAADTLIGLGGDDTYLVHRSADTAIEAAGEGTDTVRADVSYTLGAGQEIEVLSASNSADTAALHLTGNEFANTVTGNAGNNWLNSGGVSGPADTLIGLGGDDWYFVYRSNDVVVEAIGGGNDWVFAAADYTLAAGQSIESLSTDNNAGTAGLHLTGNAFANRILGNAGNNVLDGGGGPNDPADDLSGLGGNDTYIVHRSADTITEAVGGGTDTVLTDVSYTLGAGQEIEALSASNSAGTAALHLTGNAFANTITGNAGDNWLNYGGVDGPADTMIGLGGDDWYFVYRSNDVVVEASGGGNDWVFAAADYTLAAGQSIETLSTDNNAGTAALHLTGNAFANRILGNAGNNVLDGGGGPNDPADDLSGLGGNDTYIVHRGADTITESIGGGTDTVLTDVSYTLAASQEIEALSASNSAGTAALHLTGNEFANTITGNAGDNVLDGGSSGAADTLAGLGGDDTYLVHRSNDRALEAIGGGTDTVRTDVSYTLEAGQEIEALSASNSAGTAALHLTGNAFANTITGNAGNNWLNSSGAAGPADTMIGLGGDDWYFVYRSNDVVVEASGGGNDWVFAAVDYTLAAGQSIETLSTDNNAGTAALHLTGNEFANRILGNAGNNVLDGGGGPSDPADNLSGLGGNDTYIVHRGADTITESIGGGTDTVLTDVSYTLAAGQEIEALSASNSAGTAALHLTGNEFANTITGNAGNNVLDGGSSGAADTLAGLGGDDTYLVHRSNDRALEAIGGGTDTVRTDVSYTLEAGQEIEALSASNSAGTAALHLTGNEFANTITGNAGNNWLNSSGAAGPADTLIGLGGDDWYFVYRSNDVVVEASGGGNDWVFAAADYTLAAGQSIETLSTDNNAGTAALHLTGNAFANRILGNAGNNVLDGGGGPNDPADDLSGLGGNDTYIVHRGADTITETIGGGTDTVLTDVSYTLAAGQEIEALSASNSAGTAALHLTGNEFANTITGNAGDNTIDGGAGADILSGGAGNDTYLVDDSGDQIIENPNGGADIVFSASDYVLPDNVEILALGGLAVTATGSSQDNILYGNAGANVLDGRSGADVMVGREGNDDYVVDNTGDVVIENPDEGIDTVHSSVNYVLPTNVENLQLLASAGSANGNDANNVITGTAQDNVINGRSGNDTLTGGGGSDTFVFRLEGGGHSTITDFDVADDILAFGATLYASAADVQLHAAQVVDTLVIQYDAANSVALQNVTYADFFAHPNDVLII